MKNILLLLLLLFFGGCNVRLKKTSHKDFDKIDYYKYGISSTPINLNQILDNRYKSEQDSIKYGVLLENIPQKIDDTGFISILNYISFKKVAVNEENFEEINSVLSKELKNLRTGTGCPTLYTNILIFRQKNKIVQIVKIDFNCEMVWLLSNTNKLITKSSTENLENLLTATK